MDYTSSNSYVTDAGTGQRMHLQAQATPTAVSDTDLNGVIWELLELIKAGGVVPVAFDKAAPGSYKQVVAAIAALTRKQTYSAYTTTGAAGAFVLTPLFPITAYAAGLRWRVKFSVTGLAANTLDVSGLGAKSIKQYDDAGAKVAAVIVSGQLADIEYDGVDFVVLNPLPQVSRVGAWASMVNLAADTTVTSAYANKCIGVTVAGITLTLNEAGFAIGDRLSFLARVAFSLASADASSFQWPGVRTETSLSFDKGQSVSMIYDGANWIIESFMGNSTQLVDVGTVFDFAGTSAPANSFVLPTAPTNISRGSYSLLFSVIGTTWGAGDGSTTFGCPWVAADGVTLMSSGNVGTSTTGSVIAHTHRPVFGGTPSTGTSVYNNSGNSGLGAGASSITSSILTIESTGGAANVAAGTRMLKCIKYR